MGCTDTFRYMTWEVIILEFMSVHGTVNGEKIENLAPKSGLQANLFDQIYFLKPKNDLPNQVT